MLSRVMDRIASNGLSRPEISAPADRPTRSTSVSVVIPCYNYGHYLTGCVQSALTQQFVDVNVVIVDDASTDDSLEVARRLAKADARVQVIEHITNKGPVATFNDGLAEATGEYTLLISADDLIAPGALARAVALMEANPSVGMTFGRTKVFGDHPPEAGNGPARAFAVWSGRDWIRDRCAIGTNPIRSPEALMRTEVLRAVGEYNPEIRHAHDFEVWLRTAAVSDIGYVAGPPQAFYRDHGANLHTVTFQQGRPDGMLIDLEQRLMAFESVLGEGSRVPDAQALFLQARRALAREALTLAIRSYEWGKAAAWPVADLAEFAQRLCPPELLRHHWRYLAVCRRIGPDRGRRHPLLLPGEQYYKLSDRFARWRYQRLGV